jgi:hypothetical protein
MFRVRVDVLYRRAIRTSGILPVKSLIKVVQILALSLGLFDFQGFLPFLIWFTEVYDTPKALDVL